MKFLACGSLWTPHWGPQVKAERALHLNASLSGCRASWVPPGVIVASGGLCIVRPCDGSETLTALLMLLISHRQPFMAVSLPEGDGLDCGCRSRGSGRRRCVGHGSVFTHRRK